MNNHILPDYLYKIIPFVYIALGIYIWIKLDTVYALISGAMMVGAGLVAFLMRQSASYQDSRRRVKQQKANEYNVGEGGVNPTVEK